jgi:hypothetical protein
MSYLRSMSADIWIAGIQNHAQCQEQFAIELLDGTARADDLTVGLC